MNKGTSPPLGKGGCASKKTVPFLSGADGEGRRLVEVGSVSDLPRRAEDKERYIFLDRRVAPSSKAHLSKLDIASDLG